MCYCSHVWMIGKKVMEYFQIQLLCCTRRLCFWMFYTLPWWWCLNGWGKKVCLRCIEWFETCYWSLVVAWQALHEEQTKLKPLLAALKNLTSQMQTASTDDATKKDLKEDLFRLEARNAWIRDELSKKLEHLRGLEDGWKKYESEERKMTEWLEATSSSLDEIEKITGLPEKSLRRAEVSVPSTLQWIQLHWMFWMTPCGHQPCPP